MFIDEINHLENNAPLRLSSLNDMVLCSFTSGFSWLISKATHKPDVY